MELNEKIDFKTIRDFGGLLNVTFEFIRQNFRKLFLSLLLIVGPAILLLGIASGYHQSNIFGGYIRSFSSLIGSFGLVYLMMLIVMQLLLCVTYSYIDLYLNRNLNEFEVSDVWEGVKGNFGMFFVTSIGAGLVVIAASILLIIPGIYMLVVTALIYMVRMREKLSFFDALRRCRDLISGNWWFTFGLIFILYLIESFFGTILSLPQIVFGIIRSIHIIKQNSISGTGNIIIAITSIISAFSYIFYTIVLIGIAFQYYNLVEKKEAAGLYEKLESINGLN